MKLANEFKLATLHLNLHLFNNTVTTTEAAMSVEMKTFYNKDLIERAKPFLVHDQFAQEKDIPKHGGKSVEFRGFNPLPKAMTPLVEGVTPDGKKLSPYALTATVQQYGDYIELSDMVQTTTIDNTLLEANELLGEQAGETLDTVSREVMNGGTTVQYQENAVLARHLLTPTHVLTQKCVEIGATRLKVNKAQRFDRDYRGIIHPNAVYDLRQDKNWQEVASYAEPDQRLTNEVGRVAGIRFVESTEAKVFRAKDLTSESRNLVVKTVSGNVVTLDRTITSEDATALVGRIVLMGGGKYTVAAATTTSITISETLQSDVVASVTIYPGEAGAEGRPVYSTLILGKNAYATTKIEGMGLQMIVKQLGSAGTADPLNQRGTAGWKATKVTKILQELNMIRIEHMASLDHEQEYIES